VQITFFLGLSGSFLLTQEQKINDVSYHSLPRHLEGCRRPKEGCVTPASSRPRALRSKGNPPESPSGPCCAWTKATPARVPALGSATRWQAMLTGSPSRPHERPRCRPGPRAAPMLWTEMLPKKMAHQHYLAPSSRPAQPKSTGPPAQCPPPTKQPAPPKLFGGLI
jgi:hypothetical protein